MSVFALPDSCVIVTSEDAYKLAIILTNMRQRFRRDGIEWSDDLAEMLDTFDRAGSSPVPVKEVSQEVEEVDPDYTVTVSDYATARGLSCEYVRRQCRDGSIDSVKVDGTWMLSCSV
jgi:hypothetical protein